MDISFGFIRSKWCSFFNDDRPWWIFSTSLIARKTTITSIFSVDEKYKYGNLFSKGMISKIAEEIN